MYRRIEVVFEWFLVVSEVPELYRKLREACRKNCPQVSSKSASVTSSILEEIIFSLGKVRLAICAGAHAARRKKRRLSVPVKGI